MTDEASTDLRDRIMADPGLILEDHQLMRALLSADRRAAGRNVVDLRGIRCTAPVSRCSTRPTSPASCRC
jgi:hypothetical protein